MLIASIEAVMFAVVSTEVVTVGGITASAIVVDVFELPAASVTLTGRATSPIAVVFAANCHTPPTLVIP